MLLFLRELAVPSQTEAMITAVEQSLVLLPRLDIFDIALEDDFLVEQLAAICEIVTSRSIPTSGDDFGPLKTLRVAFTGVPPERLKDAKVSRHLQALRDWQEQGLLDFHVRNDWNDS
jgi:hypothetical protein